jgi:hypothetical protein
MKMIAEDYEKLKLDPTNEFKPFIVFDKSERCHLWGNHDTCNGTIMIGQTFHVYCDCDCHKQKDA